MKKIRELNFDFSEIIYVDVDALDQETRKIFIPRLRAMELRVAGLKGDLIKQQTGISNSEQSRLFKRFISLDSDGKYWGGRALLPGQHINGYQRKASIHKKRSSQHGSLSGILTATFKKYPKVEEDFIAEIWSFHRLNRGMKFDLGILYSAFKKLLREAGVRDDEWPFSEKRGGRRTVQKFIKKVLETDYIRASLSLGSKGLTHARLGSGEMGLIDANIPFDTIELDAYKVDKFCIMNVEPLPGIYVPRLIERFWLLGVAEKSTKGFLACRFVFSSEVRAQDVHDILIDAFLGDWKPMSYISVKDLNYPPGSGMMGYILPEIRNMLWSTVSLDNAMAHHANKVKEKLRQNLGFSINYGQLGHPERRWLIENTFKQISHKIMHRVPSTTGSNPNDGRADKPEEKAEIYEVFVDEAQQILDVWVATYNITPQMGSNFSKSPAEMMHAYLHNKKQRLIFPKANNAVVNKVQLRADFEIRIVRGSYESGVAPHITLAKAKYTNSVLSRSPNLFGTELLIKINPDDYRTVEAILPDGTSLGTLTVLGYWRKTRHSGITRKIINQAYNDRTFELTYLDDIVLSYLHHLARNPNKKHNLGFTRMYYELMLKGYDGESELLDDLSDAQPSASDNDPGAVDLPQESAGIAVLDERKSIDDEFWETPGGTE